MRNIVALNRNAAPGKAPNAAVGHYPPVPPVPYTFSGTTNGLR